jgi:hypothetical protein
LGGGTPRDLVRGCAAHLLADRLWHDTVLVEFRAHAPPHLPRSDVDRLYYAEMDLIEGALYTSQPWRVWAEEMLTMVVAEAVPGYVTAEDLDWWRGCTLARWPALAARSSEERPRYASVARVLCFVGEAADLVAAARAWPEW